MQHIFFQIFLFAVQMQESYERVTHLDVVITGFSAEVNDFDENEATDTCADLHRAVVVVVVVERVVG